ncbi:hypothetical protein [Enterococcus alishanensis]
MEIVLLLNTKKIPLDMQNRFGNIYPLDIPFKQKKIRDYLFHQYKEADKIFIVNETNSKEESQLVKKVSDHHEIYEIGLLPKESVTLLNVVTNTLNNVLKWLGTDVAVTINFGDTIIQNSPIEVKNDYLFVGNKVRQTPWDSVSREKGNLLFTYRNTPVYKRQEMEAVAGVFHFTSGIDLLESCENISKKGDSSLEDEDIHDLYSAFSFYDQKYHKMQIKKTSDWLDFGHTEEYLETKKIVQARFFNEISIDEKRGILTKQSQNSEKFIGEIKWYLNLPSKLQYLTPRIYDSQIEDSVPSVKMEYYPYETLHNLYIYGQLDLGFWEQSIEKLLFVQDELREHSRTNIVLSNKDLSDIYLDKTISRLVDLTKSSQFSHLEQQATIINGVKYSSISVMKQWLPQILQQNALLEERSGKIIHGDFCISNILYDAESKIVKLIDPRGKFGSQDIYGDEFYDIAKLLHSFEGSYDHIITDNFSLIEDSPESFQYEIKKTPLQEKITELVISKITRFYDIKKARLVEGILFLSMIPLHSDYPDRQKIMYGQAMKLLQPYIGELL